MADAGRVVTVVVTPVDYRQGGPRSPFRVYAADRDGNYLTLTYFHNPGWAKKQLPLGEPQVVSGRMEMYGQELQIVHPDHVLQPDEARDLPEREPVYPLSEGPDQPPPRRARRPGAGAGARRWPNGSSRACCAARGWPGWPEALAQRPSQPRRRRRRASGSLMTRCSPTSSP